LTRPIGFSGASAAPGRESHSIDGPALSPAESPANGDTFRVSDGIEVDAGTIKNHPTNAAQARI
jgi:hypothetical protein